MGGQGGREEGRVRRGEIESLGGASDYVDGSLVGKRGMLFSGDLVSRAAHLAVKVGHFHETLLWVEAGPHETQRGGQLGVHCKVPWSGLAQRAQTLVLGHLEQM